MYDTYTSANCIALAIVSIEQPHRCMIYLVGGGGVGIHVARLNVKQITYIACKTF